VKLQIEFNPAQVQAYRLVGYENRMLANRDFHDDSKDAGEIGAGHTVTALYELVPASGSVTPQGEKLRYQPQPVEGKRAEAAPENTSRELLTLQLRFKRPEADRSELRDYPLADRGGKFSKASTDFRFASAVAMFGLVLRGSPYRGSATLAATEEIASSSLGEDSRGYRSEFIDLVRKAEQLK
jgi:Ca-activated chloride channel family protein